MGRTEIRSEQLRDGQGVKRSDLDTTTSGSAVIAKLVAGTLIGLSSTGPDAGTGDVTVNLQAQASGGVLLYDASGSPTHYTAGASGQVLTKQNDGSWAAANPSSTFDASTTAFFADEFLGGMALDSAMSNVIVSQGWNTSYGGDYVMSLNGEAGHPGIYRISTGTSSGSVISMALDAASGASRASRQTIAVADMFEVVWIARLISNDLNTIVRLGLSVTANEGGRAFTETTPYTGIYLEKLGADTSWYGVCRHANVQTRSAAVTSSGTGWIRIRIRRDGNIIKFSINGGAEQSVSSNIPTGALQPGMHIINGAAANKSIDIDYCHIRITGISR